MPSTIKTRSETVAGIWVACDPAGELVGFYSAEPRLVLAREPDSVKSHQYFECKDKLIYCTPLPVFKRLFSGLVGIEMFPGVCMQVSLSMEMLNGYKYTPDGKQVVGL